jgi:hypothetical protein
MAQDDMTSIPRVHEALSSLLAASAMKNANETLLQKAVSHARVAAAGFEKVGNERHLAHLHMNLGIGLAEFGHWAEAEQHYAAAQAAARRWLSGALSLTASSAMSQELYRSAAARAHLQARRGALFDCIGTLESAIGLALEAPTEQNDTSAPLRRERNQLLAVLESNVPAREYVFEENVRRLKEINSILRDREIGSNCDVDQVNEYLVRAIPVGGAILIPLFGRAGDVIVCAHRVSEGGSPHVAAVDCPGLEPAVREVLVARSTLSGIPPKEQAKRLTDALYILGTVLRGSLMQYLRGLQLRPTAEVIMIAHGLSAVVPWHAAHWDEAGAPHFLDDLFIISTAPSLRWLASSAQHSCEPTKEGRIGAVIDPTGDLPGARLEGTCIPAQSRLGQVITLVGEEATLERATAVLSTCEHVHLAMHSDFHWDMPFHSALHLSGAKLTVAELIAHNEVPPRTIVLSSCSSGLSNMLQISSDHWGFPLALHRWGVASVVASAWDVSDAAMLLLFSEFYRHACWMDKPLLALWEARRFLRKQSLDSACDRLRSIAGNLPSGVRQELKAIEESFGQVAPFIHPLLWAPMYYSGQRLRQSLHDTVPPVSCGDCGRVHPDVVQ